MFGYICIAIALILALRSSIEYRAIGYLVLLEFVLHKLAFVTGFQLVYILKGSLLFLSYIFIELLAIYLMYKMQSHLVITLLIFVNLIYNVLTISQYVNFTYDFYALYSNFVGVIMVLELIYLAGLSQYVANYRRKHGRVDINSVDSLFRVRRLIRGGNIL